MAQQTQNEETWGPQWAPAVSGTYPKRTFDELTGQPNEQLIQIKCKKCGATWQVRCTSGLVRLFGC